MYQVCLYREGAMGKISYDLVFPIIIKSLDLVIIFVPVILVLDGINFDYIMDNHWRKYEITTIQVIDMS